MEVNIKNCNNIESARISVVDGKLNIKFAPNGTGKSTIAKAIQYGATDDGGSLNELAPFKYRENNPGSARPEVDGVGEINEVMCFNEEYVSQFTFKSEELVSNSFDIFIRTDAYKATELEILELVQEIRQQFTNNPELEELISNLKELSGAFKVTASGGLSKASVGMKGLAGGNKIEHIPAGLEPYQPFIQSQKSVNWLDWQAKGHKEFSGLSDACPYCTSDSSGKKEQIARVSQEYDKNHIKNLVGIIEVIKKLGEFFSTEYRDKLDVITSLKDGIENEHETCIVTVKSQIDDLVEKLEVLKKLSVFHFREGESVSERLQLYKIDLKFFDALDSERTNKSIGAINCSLDRLIEKAGQLQGRINIQRRNMRNLVEKHQNDINGFLSYAGYQYRVEIVGDGEGSQLKLRYIEHSSYLKGGSQHLSFGERNAFSIVLFMYECLSKNPGLVILDDPISSFDKNKKYAILQMLFRRDAGECLKGRTVLMLTHDVEPIIDTLKSVRDQFSNQVCASYLNLRDGVVYEQDIRGNDLKTFSQICDEVVASERNDITKLIYLRRRYEILDDKGDAYQVLSNLLHKRVIPIDSREAADEEHGYPVMDPRKVSSGVEEISRFIDGFDYESFLNSLSNKALVRDLYLHSDNGYEKLQLYRVLADGDVGNSVVRKFMNETYHIENEYICQLDPTTFDLIPEYVINECDRLIADATE